MSNEKMREEFEAWARKMSMDIEHRNIPGVGKFYECPRTLLAFEAWQASRAAIEVVPVSDTCIRLRNYTPYDVKDLLIGAIESLGLKVKP